jgi:AcrR family transcriptional regulator
MPRKPAKAYHHGDLRDALIRAGRAILEESGSDSLTLRACARRAGVSHAAPQHHFASAADLLAAIAASGFKDFVAALDRASSPMALARDRLLAMGHGYVAFAEEHPAVYLLMFGQKVPVQSDHLQDAMSDAWDQLTTAVTALGGSAAAESNAIHVWSLVHGFAMLRIMKRMPPVDSGTALEAMLEKLVDAVAAPA